MHKRRLRHIDLITIRRQIAELSITWKPCNRVHIGYTVMWTKPQMGLTRLRTHTGHTHMSILQGKKMGRSVHETRLSHGRPHIGVQVGIGITEKQLTLRIAHAKMGLKLHRILHQITRIYKGRIRWHNLTGEQIKPKIKKKKQIQIRRNSLYIDTPILCICACKQRH